MLKWGRRVNTAEGVDGRGLGCGVVVASMGPPCEHGGRSPAAALALVAEIRLQWGRRVNTAEGRRLPTAVWSRQYAKMGPPCEHGGRSGWTRARVRRSRRFNGAAV